MYRRDVWRALLVVVCGVRVGAWWRVVGIDCVLL